LGIGYLETFGYVFCLIGIVGLAQKLWNFPQELSRKLIHIFLSFTWLFLYKFFTGNWQILIIPISFIVINYASYRFGFFTMIERAEGNNHMGTVYFAVAMTILMIFSLIFPERVLCTGIAVFCLCFGDGVAAIAGGNARNPIYIRKHKTVQGFFGCVLGAMFGLFVFSAVTSCPILWYHYLALSIATGLAELVENGLDNYSVSFGVYAVAMLLGVGL